MKVNVFGPKLKTSDINTHNMMSTIFNPSLWNKASKLAHATTSNTARNKNVIVSMFLRSKRLIKAITSKEPMIDEMDTV